MSGIKFTPLGGLNSETDISSAVLLNPANGARKLLMQVFGQNARYTLVLADTPALDRGFRLPAEAEPLVILLTSGMVVKVIAEGEGAVFAFQWGR